MPKLSSESSFVLCIYFLSPEQMAPAPNYFNFPHRVSWKSSYASCLSMLNNSVTQTARLLRSLSTLYYYNKSKSVIAWGQDRRYYKRAEEIWGLMDSFIILTVMMAYGYIMDQLTECTLSLCQLYFYKDVKNTINMFPSHNPFLQSRNQWTNIDLLPPLAICIPDKNKVFLKQHLREVIHSIISFTQIKHYFSSKASIIYFIMLIKKESHLIHVWNQWIICLSREKYILSE